MANNYRIYRPNKSGNGAASEFQLSYKENNKFDKWMMFLSVAKQVGEDDKGNAKIDWENGITVKLGLNDLSEILAVLEGRQEQVGFKGSLFHQTPNGGNKVINFNYNKDKGGFYLKVSAKDKEGNQVGPIGHGISEGEGLILKHLIYRGVEYMCQWSNVILGKPVKGITKSSIANEDSPF